MFRLHLHFVRDEFLLYLFLRRYAFVRLTFLTFRLFRLRLKLEHKLEMIIKRETFKATSFLLLFQVMGNHSHLFCLNLLIFSYSHFSSLFLLTHTFFHPYSSLFHPSYPFSKHSSFHFWHPFYRLSHTCEFKPIRPHFHEWLHCYRWLKFYTKMYHI